MNNLVGGEPSDLEYRVHALDFALRATTNEPRLMPAHVIYAAKEFEDYLRNGATK
jgi:hypothetical protein